MIATRNCSHRPTTNRITTAGFAYDAAGNQVRALIPGSTASQRFQYDAASRLVKVKADDNVTVLASYTYGDSNERLITDESGYRTYYVSEGGTVIAEYSETPALPTTPTWSKSYVYLGGRLLSTLTPNGSGGEATEFHHPDRLGTRLVTNPLTGTSFEQVSLPFGTALDAESTGATNRRFTSYDRSTTSGLDYAVNRHYDSQQGRFTQVDPAGMGATSLASPQTFNLYAYCANDPINHIDPSGLGFFSFLKKAFKWIGIALSIALIVIGTAGLMLAASLPAFLPLIGSTAGLASAITAASIGMLVTGALGLVSQVAGGKVGFIAGLALIGWDVFNFIGSLSKGNGFGFDLQDGVYSPGDVPGLTGPCSSGACVVSIFANYTAREMALWRALGHARDFFFGVFDNGVGPPPILGFSVTKYIRRRLDSIVNAPKVNEDSWSYYAGSWVPDVVAAAAGGGTAASEEVFGISGRIALDVKPHPFPSLGRYSHLQLDLWKTGVKGSNFFTRRVPLFTRLSNKWKAVRNFRF